MTGGGDHTTMSKSTFENHELINQSGVGYSMMKKANMKFSRHGHAACNFLGKYMIVSGSRKDNYKASASCEAYVLATDTWVELPMMTQPRHYHSMNAFNNSYVYVFCGISNLNKSYLNTCERLNVG